MTSPVENDLNQVIANAVTARIEAQVAAALSGDEVIGKYVAAALNQPIEVGSSYDRRRTTFLRETIDTAMRDATRDAVKRVIAEHSAEIQLAVQSAMRGSLDVIAAQLVKSLADSAENPYGIKVLLDYPKRD